MQYPTMNRCQSWMILKQCNIKFIRPNCKFLNNFYVKISIETFLLFLANVTVSPFSARHVLVACNAVCIVVFQQLVIRRAKKRLFLRLFNSLHRLHTRSTKSQWRDNRKYLLFKNVAKSSGDSKGGQGGRLPVKRLAACVHSPQTQCQMVLLKE